MERIRGNMTMENTLNLILEKLETMDKRLQNIEGEVQGLKEFQKVVTTEFDTIKTDMVEIKELASVSTIDIEYLAKKVGQHDMKLNRKN